MWLTIAVGPDLQLQLSHIAETAWWHALPIIPTAAWDWTSRHSESLWVPYLAPANALGARWLIPEIPTVCRADCLLAAHLAIIISTILFAARSLDSAQIPATKEPSGLLRSEDKCPESTSLTGRAANFYTWDATLVQTPTNPSRQLLQLMQLAASCTQDKYANQPESYSYKPLAFQSFVLINSTGQSFLAELGWRISKTSGDQRGTQHLFQRTTPLPNNA